MENKVLATFEFSTPQKCNWHHQEHANSLYFFALQNIQSGEWCDPKTCRTSKFLRRRTMWNFEYCWLFLSLTITFYMAARFHMLLSPSNVSSVALWLILHCSVYILNVYNFLRNDIFSNFAVVWLPTKILSLKVRISSDLQ